MLVESYLSQIFHTLQAGCEYSHIGASSTGTQNIVNKLGNSQVVNEIRYDDIREDEKGRPFFADTGTNESIQILNVDHRTNSEL